MRSRPKITARAKTGLPTYLQIDGDMNYRGLILEDLKRMSYLLAAIGERQFADAAMHALQILDRNRDKITEYELSTNTGLKP
jgi:hypothetical protein